MIEDRQSGASPSTDADANGVSPYVNPANPTPLLRRRTSAARWFAWHQRARLGYGVMAVVAVTYASTAFISGRGPQHADRPTPVSPTESSSTVQTTSRGPVPVTGVPTRTPTSPKPTSPPTTSARRPTPSLHKPSAGQRTTAGPTSHPPPPPPPPYSPPPTFTHTRRAPATTRPIPRQTATYSPPPKRTTQRPAPQPATYNLTVTCRTSATVTFTASGAGTLHVRVTGAGSASGGSHVTVSGAAGSYHATASATGNSVYLSWSSSVSGCG